MDNDTYLAYICNDLRNAKYYKLDDKGNAYYKDKLIATLFETEVVLDGDQYNINIKFVPIKPIKIINFKGFILDKDIS